MASCERTVWEEQAEAEQSVERALLTADELGLLVLFAPAPNWEVALMRGEVQLSREVSWLKDSRKLLHPDVMPDGMSAED